MGRFKQLLVSLLLLSLIAWIVNGLAASDNVTVSAYPFIIDLSRVVEPFQYLFYLVLIVFAVGALIMLIRDRRIAIETMKGFMISRQEGRNPHNSLRTLIILVLIACASLFLIIVFSIWQLKLGSPFSSSGNQQPPASSSGPSPGATTSNSPLLPYNLFIAPALIFLVIAIVGGLMAVQAVREINEESNEVPPQSDEVLEQKAFNVVKEAISTITNEGDFRTAIILCYQRLCELLAKHNCQIRDNQTVQEFKISALKVLSIPDECFSALTQLFEEARYSLHEIDEAKKTDALECLTEIRDSLGGDSQ